MIRNGLERSKSQLRQELRFRADRRDRSTDRIGAAGTGGGPGQHEARPAREIFRVAAAVVAGDQPVVPWRAVERIDGHGRPARRAARRRGGPPVRRLEVDLLAYEQLPGKQNRNGVRFRDGAMTALGRSGTRTPYLAITFSRT